MNYLYAFLAGTVVGFYARGKLKKAVSKATSPASLADRVSRSIFGHKDDKKDGR